MANINDFKVLNNKCEQIFKNLKAEKNKTIDDDKKAGLGFYHFILEHVTGILDIDVQQEKIIDTTYNRIIFNDGKPDFGMDAVNIKTKEKDGENTIQLFNFKYRNEYKTNDKSENDICKSMKFLEFIDAEIFEPNGLDLSEKTANIIKEIRKQINESAEDFNIHLYMVSNEDGGIPISSRSYVKMLEENRDIKVVNIGLKEISKYLYDNNQKNFESCFIASKKDILDCTKNEGSTEKSYIVQLNLVDVIRILADDENLTEDYAFPNKNNDDDILSANLNLSLLYENVRGYLGDTSYNKNIIKTLNSDANNFFMYNNGITITAKNIQSKACNANKGLLFTLENFQVVNGGQTIRSIFAYIENSKNDPCKEKYLTNLNTAKVLVRIFHIEDEIYLQNKIAEYTNSQNAISFSDLKSVDPIQIQIEAFLKSHNILYIRKAGEAGDASYNYDERITKDELAQILYSAQGSPEKVSNQKQKLWSDYYSEIFADEFDFEEMLKILKKYFEINKSIKDESQKSKEKVHFSEKCYILFIKNEIDKIIEGKSVEDARNIFNDILEQKKTIKATKSRLLLKKTFVDAVKDHINSMKSK